MANINLHKIVWTLPETLEANSIYFVKVWAWFDMYITNDAGVIIGYELNLIQTKEDISNKWIANGYSPLDENSKIPAIHLPSYVNDVEEYVNYVSLPLTWEVGKIYITLDDNREYRWSGSIYVELKDSWEDVGTIWALINSATEKTTPVDTDMVWLMDSVGNNIMKKLSWANIKATLAWLFVGLTWNQTIAGSKTFTSEVSINSWWITLAINSQAINYWRVGSNYLQCIAIWWAIAFRTSNVSAVDTTSIQISRNWKVWIWQTLWTYAHISSIFELTSTTSWFLSPRMTTTQKNAIATPASWLEVIDTTLWNVPQWYNWTEWLDVFSAWTSITWLTMVTANCTLNTQFCKYKKIWKTIMMRVNYNFTVTSWTPTSITLAWFPYWSWAWRFNGTIDYYDWIWHRLSTLWNNATTWQMYFYRVDWGAITGWSVDWTIIFDVA